MTIELIRLGRSSGGDLVQPLCSMQAQLEQVAQAVSNQILNFFQLCRLQQSLCTGHSSV